jgi:hypothetical protein
MKKIVYAALGLALFAVSCKKTDNVTEKPLIPGIPASSLDTLVGTISVNTTVTKNTYLYGLVYVAPGVTLTINPGVTIFGSVNTNGGAFDAVNSFKNKGTLCIQTGAKLNAAGTPSQPIVWTSDNKIAIAARKFGDWGGVVLYGKAPFHNRTGVTTTTRYEAFDIVPTDTRNFYGGTDQNDNSGIMTYNRIENAGGVVTAVDKEVNALTFCAVGRGTVINHIEILRAGDDALEFFGGNVNVDHVLTISTKDDDFDFDEGYQGHLQFIVAFRDTTADNSGSHMIEADNDGSATNFTPYTTPFITNATLYGPTTTKTFATRPDSYFEGAIMARRNVSLRLVNSYVIGNKMPYGIIFTPTTGDFGATLLDPPSLTVPNNVQAFNIFQTDNAGFAGVCVQSPAEGNGAALPLNLVNNVNNVNKLISANNANNGLVLASDFNLGGTLENTATTPFLTTGVDLTTLGLPAPLNDFIGTNQRGGIISTDNWTLAGFTSGWIAL